LPRDKIHQRLACGLVVALPDFAQTPQRQVRINFLDTQSFADRFNRTAPDEFFAENSARSSMSQWKR